MSFVPEKAEVFPLGRPKRGENRLEAYAKDAQHPAMRFLASRAVRNGRTLEGLAAAIKRDPRALAETLTRKKPRVESVRSLVTELVPKRKLVSPAIVVARALLDELDDADQRLACRQLNGVLQAWSHSAIHPQRTRLVPFIQTELARVTPDRRRKALAHFVVALNGINEDGRHSIEVIAGVLAFRSPRSA